MQPFAIITTANALRDIQQAIDWENSRSALPGNRFFVDLNQRLHALAAVPSTGSIRYLNVRFTTTHVFPYLIHYIADDAAQTITVLRVLHIARKPLW